MRILIIDQCSASKAYKDDVEPIEFSKVDESADEILDEGNLNGIEAGDLYTGKQQNRIGTAVRTLRQNSHIVDRYFISAGFGLVSEVERLPPYDMTFSDMSNEEVRKRGDELGLTEDILELITKQDIYDIAFFALGNDYYRAFDLNRVLNDTPEDTAIVLFNREDAAEIRENAVSIPARTKQGRENDSTVIGLKGTYLKRFANSLGANTELSSKEQIVEFCTSKNTSQQSIEDFD